MSKICKNKITVKKKRFHFFIQIFRIEHTKCLMHS